MQENNYIQVLIQSLHQKVEALDCIIEKNKEQYEILTSDDVDLEAFDQNVRKKAEYVDRIVFLDDGFEEVFARVKEELDRNRPAYANEIGQMQELISQITERSMKVEAQEHRNHDLAMAQFAKAKQNIRQVKTGSQAAMQYYRNMQNLNVIEPQFMDKKK